MLNLLAWLRRSSIFRFKQGECEPRRSLRLAPASPEGMVATCLASPKRERPVAKAPFKVRQKLYRACAVLLLHKEQGNILYICGSTIPGAGPSAGLHNHFCRRCTLLGLLKCKHSLRYITYDWERQSKEAIKIVITRAVSLQVLDMPKLPDDFYMSLMDWSAQNLLAVAIGSSVYLWNAATEQVCPWRDLPVTITPCI